MLARWLRFPTARADTVALATRYPSSWKTQGREDSNLASAIRPRCLPQEELPGSCFRPLTYSIPELAPGR